MLKQDVMKMPTVTVRVIQSFYDRSHGMKFRRQGETFKEAPVRAKELTNLGLVTIVEDKKTNKKQAAAEK